MAGELPALAVPDEVVGTVSGVDELQALVNLAAQRLYAEVVAQEHSLRRAAQPNPFGIGSLLVLTDILPGSAASHMPLNSPMR
jgi:hypothetical protein